MPTNNSADAIEINIRTYRSLLKSAGKIKISQLEDAHLGMHSILHQKGPLEQIDMAAFIYTLLRLPTCMSQVKKVILGQSFSVFKKNGFRFVEDWKEVEAPGRRRKMFYNGTDTLAVYIASVSDVDDLVTLMTAFQIEWNAFHKILALTRKVQEKAAQTLSTEDRSKVEKIWGDEYHKFLTAIKYREVDFTIHLLSGSYVDYAKATQQWWDHIAAELDHLHLNNRPIYFVSSNTHSLVNLITRFVLPEEAYLSDFLHRLHDPFLTNLWEEIISIKSPITKEYFLYYIAKKALMKDINFAKRKQSLEKKSGIHCVPASHFLDIDTQVIEVKSLVKGLSKVDDGKNSSKLAKSKSVIINIDYPLGWAAYQVLTEIGQNTDLVRGIYIMGKSATLNGQIGDILIPTTVYDQHTKNVYAITNCFTSSDFQNSFTAGSVIDNQKTVCTKGTFLESNEHIENWYKQGYTIIEMETGPYLNAVYEFVYYNRYVENQFINLTNTPFDLGILHYSSDTPYSKAKNLGVRNLSYEGVESTYACSRVILQRILNQELKYLSS